ncbi:MAG: oligosaccharide flippase family protein [Bacteroidota bacterium]|nr:oligosaccharide flippase family protein [Bacteroidota bacterium]
MGFGAIADGRATQALKWIIARKESDGDVKEKQKALGSAILIWFYFLPITLLVVGGLVLALPTLINEVDLVYRNSILKIGVILGVNILVSPLLSIPDSLLIGTNRGYKSTLIQAMGHVLLNLCFLVVAYFGYGLIGMAVSTVGITLLNGIVVWIICKKSISWLGVSKPNKEETRQFFNFSLWVLIWTFIERFILASEIVLIGYFISPEMVTNYSFMSYSIQLIIVLALHTASGSMPGLGRLLNKDKNKAGSIVRILRELIYSLTLVGGIIIILFNFSFVKLWVGKEFFIGNLENTLSVIAMMSLVIMRLESQIIDLSLSIFKKVILGITGLLIGLVFSYFLFLQGYSTNGILTGIIIGRLLIWIFLSNQVNAFVRISITWIGLLKILLGMLTLILIADIRLSLDNWIQFGLWLIPLSLITGLCITWIISSRSTKSFIGSLVRNKVINK